MSGHVSATWIADYATREFKRERYATTAGMSEDVYVAAVESKLHSWVTGAEIRVRVCETGLIGIFTDRRFKVWAETGTTRSGMKNPANRLAAEERIFGLAHDADPAVRPVYGYLQGSTEGSPLTQWGSIVLGISPDVAGDATLTCGDSVDATLWHPAFVPVPLLAPDIRAVELTRPSVLSASTIGEICDGGYAEVQIHGGVPASRVTRVVYTQGASASREAQTLLAAAKLEPTFADDDDPGPPPP